MENTFEQLKKELSAYKGKRDVDMWNDLREELKVRYPMPVINYLDGSGYITQWLKEK